MDLEKKFEKLDLIKESIDKDKEEILEKWLGIESYNAFSKKAFNKKSKKILKIFGKKILEHLFDLISKDRKYGIFDTVVIIMNYFIKKRFNLTDMYRNFSDLKNVTLLFYIEKFPELKDEFYYPLAHLFDKNFIIFINEFLLDRIKNNMNIEIEENCKEKTEENLENNLIINKKREQKIKDIRYTTRDMISASEFIEKLDYTVFDKVDFMLEDIDKLIVLIYSLEDSNEFQNSSEIIHSIIEYLNDIPELMVSLGVFEIIERSFQDLIEFLSNIKEEMLKNKEKKSLLVNLLLSLIFDFENWLKTMFIDKSARDIHYFDSSFSSNILKIENIFKEEEGNNENEDCEIDFF